MTRMTLEVRGVKIYLGIEGDHLREVSLPRKVPQNLDRGTLDEILNELSKYKPAFDDATDFRQKVWKRLMKIPLGKTMTYGELATAVGNPKAYRAAGSAVGANPLLLIVPCHRIVGKNGLGGFRCGLAWKKKLLELEAGKNISHRARFPLK
jgi:O-6-methylguanine DNA methyltransferase